MGSTGRAYASHVRYPMGRAPAFQLQWDHLRIVALVCFFLLIWFFPNPNAVSFREDPTAGREGNILSQILWFSILGFGLLNMQDRWRAVRQQYDLTLLLLLAWCAFSVPLAILPDVSMRRFLYTVIAMSVAMICIASPSRAETFVKVMVAVIFFETLTKYIFVFALPQIGRHTSNSFEPQLAGLWKGQFAHKNVAGPVVVMELFILHAARKYIQPLLLWFLVIPQAVFLVFSGSKTSFGLLIVVVLAVRVLIRMRSSLAILLSVGFGVLCINALTVFSTMNETMQNVTRALVGDASFTGRTDVWAMLIEYVSENPLMGAGFMSFWQIGTLSPAARDGTTWVSQAIYGHQGYLDLAATIGIPGLALALLFLVVRPCLDIAAIQNRANPLLAMYASFWLFALLQNGTESNLLGRADGVWLLCVVGIAGVRRCLVDERRARRAAEVV